MANILLLGHGAREHALAEAFKKNVNVNLYSFMKSNNPGISELSQESKISDYSNNEEIIEFAKKNDIDYAFIGPEDPLRNGIVDSFTSNGIDAIGPPMNLAKLETSKSFTRELLSKYNIIGNPKYKVINIDNIREIDKWIDEFDQVVIKPDGLTGGKGVKVQGEHLKSKDDAILYCKEVLKSHPSVIIEEKLDGEEFSLQCITDGKTVIATPPAQDHKRAFEGDKGPNTGGMGSYSSENHLLPFLKKEHVDSALEITKKVAEAIYQETGKYYKGIMYGGFILTKKGVKLIEYNARFGDPEAMNVLPLLKTDFSTICQAIIVQELDRVKVEFEKKATVLKYVVPEGYPSNPVKNEKIIIESGNGYKVYYASVEKKEDGLFMSGSRAVAFLGIGANLEEAEKKSEEGASNTQGKVFYRKDIGTKGLIEKRVTHINAINR